jgi:hypothetical protein
MRLVPAPIVLIRALVVAAFLLVLVDPSPAKAASDAPTWIDDTVTLNITELRDEALARLAPQVRDLLRSVRIVVVPRPIPRTAPGAAACFDIQSGVVMLGADIQERYGRDFARSALMHEYGHALAWLRYRWDLREFRSRVLNALAMPGVEKYPVFTAFVGSHRQDVYTKTDYSELFPAVLLEVRSASVLPPPLRSYLAPLMWP